MLLGDYGGPGQYGNDTLGYNPEGKERFRKDALKYLKRVGWHLCWDGKPNFNPGGIAGSGDATAHFAFHGGTGVYINISDGSAVPMVRSSVQGVQIMWRSKFRTAGTSVDATNGRTGTPQLSVSR